jgi:signal transduction histidine kinase
MGRLPRVSPGWHAEEDAHSQRPLAILSAILSAIWEMLGVRALYWESVDLSDITLDVYEQARGMPIARGRHLQQLVAPRPILVRGDAGRLHQVLLNLVVNGLQHVPTPTDGSAWRWLASDLTRR